MTNLREQAMELVLKVSKSWSMELNVDEAAELIDTVADVLLEPTEEALQALRDSMADDVFGGYKADLAAAFAAQRTQARESRTIRTFGEQFKNEEKPVNDDKMFLRITFGDNDFGWPVERALERIWFWMRKSHGRGVELSSYFEKLHKSGLLLKMIERAIDAENHYNAVEYGTRLGRYEEEIEDTEYPLSLLVGSFDPLTKRYLYIKIDFLSKESNEWANGEEAVLNLQTGQVNIY